MKPPKKPASPKNVRFDLGLSGLTFEVPSIPSLTQHDEKDKLGELRFYHKRFGGLDWFGGSFVLKPEAELDVVKQANLNVQNAFRQLGLPVPESLMQNKQPLGKAESASVFGESLTDKGEVLAACRFVKLDRNVWYVLMTWKASDEKAAKQCMQIVASAKLDK